MLPSAPVLEMEGRETLGDDGISCSKFHSSTTSSVVPADCCLWGALASRLTGTNEAARMNDIHVHIGFEAGMTPASVT